MRLAEAIDAPYHFLQRHWWAWPTAMVMVGLVALATSLIVYPGPEEWSYWFGMQFGGPCGFEDTTGYACPSCGMTRSWTWLVRGHVVKAFTYNAAGASLLLSLWLMGVIGAVRLAFRDPKKLKIPGHILSILVIVWMVVPYLGLWIARVLGFNTLP